MYSIEEAPPPKTIEDFDEYFQIGKDIPERMVGFLSSLGGLESNTVRILSVCNQAATAAAVIELKTTLGFSNATTDMINTWHFDIVISPTQIEVINTKREQSMQRTFEFEWQFVTQFSRSPLSCTDVILTVTDLVFSKNAAALQMNDVCQRLDALLSPSLRTELSLNHCFGADEPSSSASPPHASSHAEYSVTGFMRKVGGNRKKPGNWQRRWFGLSEDGCLYYFKAAPAQKKLPRPSGVIELKQLLAMGLADEQTKKLNTFRLETPDRTYYLQTTTFDEIQAWGKAIAQFLSPTAEVDPAMVAAPLPAQASSSVDHQGTPGRAKSTTPQKKKNSSSTWGKSLFGARRAKVSTSLFVDDGSAVSELAASTDCAPSSPFPGVQLHTESPPTLDFSASVPDSLASPHRVRSVQSSKRNRTSSHKKHPSDATPLPSKTKRKPIAKVHTLEKDLHLTPRRLDRSGSIDSRSHQFVSKDSPPQVIFDMADPEMASLRSRNQKLRRQLQVAQEQNLHLQKIVDELRAEIEILKSEKS